MGKTLVNIEDDKFGFKTILHIIVGCLIFAISQLTASIVVDTFYKLTKFNFLSLYVMLRCLFEIGLFYLIMRFYIYRVLKLNFTYFRITKPRVSLLWIVIALLLPFTVILYYFTFVNGKLFYGDSNTILLNITFALKAGLSAGIIEEFFFRGFTMKLVENRWNSKIAIIIPSVTFASLHLIKGMDSSNIVLLLIAGTTAGVMFSMITYYSNNIWNSVIVHAVWNMLIIGIFHISSQNDLITVFNYSFENQNILITGGKFGIEASLPAIIGYITVITITIVMKHKKSL
ncbi:MAG: CPBP family intramembrane metalloprotease [Firmicutes bacterium]|nr:CPBP family intramembrane metalloprotease [Bacillota bacterium]